MERKGESGGVRIQGPRNVAYIFVDNLPSSMSVEWFWQIFKHEGEVPFSVSHKSRKTNRNKFGFVRFGNRED